MKHFPSSTREWNNSLYTFNKNVLIKIPVASNLAISFIKSYFNLYDALLEKKIRKNRIKLRLKRLSSNKMFISNGEFKHTNNKLIITLYLFNRQKLNYSLNLKKSYLKIFKFFSNKLNNKFHFITKKSLYKLFKVKQSLLLNDKHNTENYANYTGIFYKKLLNKKLMKLSRYVYYKQLIYINNSKYNYTFLSRVKTYLELLFNKTVEFNIINIRRFYLNNEIMVDSITTKITKNRRKLARFLKKLQNKIKIKNKLSILAHKAKDINGLNNFIFGNLRYKHVYGFRIEAKGRLTRRYTASRSRFIFKYKGGLTDLDSSYKGLSSVLLKGNLKSNIQHTMLKSSTRIGSFGVKGWLSGN